MEVEGSEGEVKYTINIPNFSTYKDFNHTFTQHLSLSLNGLRSAWLLTLTPYYLPSNNDSTIDVDNSTAIHRDVGISLECVHCSITHPDLDIYCRVEGRNQQQQHQQHERKLSRDGENKNCWRGVLVPRLALSVFKLMKDDQFSATLRIVVRGGEVWRHEDPLEELSRQLGQLLHSTGITTESAGADVEVLTNDGTRIPAHSSILLARSNLLIGKRVLNAHGDTSTQNEEIKREGKQCIPRDNDEMKRAGTPLNSTFGSCTSSGYQQQSISTSPDSTTTHTGSAPFYSSVRTSTPMSIRASATPKAMTTTVPGKRRPTPSKLCVTTSKLGSKANKLSTTPSKLHSMSSKLSTTPSKLSTTPGNLRSTPSKLESTPSKTTSIIFDHQNPNRGHPAASPKPPAHMTTTTRPTGKRSLNPSSVTPSKRHGIHSSGYSAPDGQHKEDHHDHHDEDTENKPPKERLKYFPSTCSSSSSSYSSSSSSSSSTVPQEVNKGAGGDDCEVMKIPVNMSASVAKQMLEWLYTGRCSELGRLAKPLLVGGLRHDVGGLARSCEHHLAATLTPPTTPHTLLLADKYGASTLRHHSLMYAVQWAHEVTQQPSWNTVAARSPGLIADFSRQLALHHHHAHAHSPAHTYVR